MTHRLFMTEDDDPEVYDAMVRMAKRENDALLEADRWQARAFADEREIERLRETLRALDDSNEIRSASARGAVRTALSREGPSGSPSEASACTPATDEPNPSSEDTP